MPRGGARDGAGRKRLDEDGELIHSTSVVLVQSDIDYVNSLDGKNFSDKIRKIIDFYRENHK